MIKMFCNICGTMLNYLGHDCYACPIHSFDYMMDARTYLKNTYNVDEDEVESMMKTSHEVPVKL